MLRTESPPPIVFMNAQHFTRPVRGAVRLDDFRWDVEPIRKELELFASTDWKDRDYGTHWSDIALFVRGKGKIDNHHPALDRAPALAAVLKSFPAPVVDMCLASLQPGGSIKEHRDISGGTAANVTRLHVPIVTHPDVSFFVSGERVTMGEGELWHLDTTYRHRVINESEINRIHLIVDLESTPDLLALLPAVDFRDRLHTIAFWGICIVKGTSLIVRNPRSFVKRCRDFVRLRFRRESVLYTNDDIQ